MPKYKIILTRNQSVEMIVEANNREAVKSFDFKILRENLSSGIDETIDYIEYVNKSKEIDNSSLYIDLIKDINTVTGNWLDYVTGLNQCAYTDRGIETIIELAELLKKNYLKGENL